MRGILADLTRRWNTSAPPGQQLRFIHDKHTEFVVGCSWALFDEGALASSGWDGRVNVFRVL
jgi:peroxin-7